MGQETCCVVHLNDQAGEGVALLETDEILFRGPFRLRIPFTALRSLDAAGGLLTIDWAEGRAVFELGPLAERWAEKIRHPKSLLDRLGVKPAQRVLAVGLQDEAFLSELRGRAVGIVEAKAQPAERCDMVFLGAEGREDLAALEEFRGRIKKDGAIWVVYPKGRQEIRERDVLAAAKEAGLVDVKVTRFSETHTALKMVIPRERRQGT